MPHGDWTGILPTKNQEGVWASLLPRKSTRKSQAAITCQATSSREGTFLGMHFGVSCNTTPSPCIIIKYSALLKSENKKLEFIIRMKCFLHSWGRMETAYCSEGQCWLPLRAHPCSRGIKWEDHDRSQLLWNSWGRGWLGQWGIILTIHLEWG